jgi:D-erythro-7,8-dihydroneopterin triphosphate epimerase
MRIHIKNLRLRTIVGVDAPERERPQDVIVNVTMDFDGSKAAISDDIGDTVDYEAAKRRIAAEVESADFHLLERLAHRILEVVMEDPRVRRATVEVDKPHALRFTDSVSVSCSTDREK